MENKDLNKMLIENKDRMNALMRMSNKDAHKLKGEIIEEKTNLFYQLKKYIMKYIFKIKNIFKEKAIKLVEPYIIKRELEREDNLKQHTEKIKNSLLATSAYEYEKHYEMLKRIRDENKGASLNNRIPMLFDPEVCLEHNNDIERFSQPSFKEVISNENKITKKILDRQNDKNYTKRKVDLIIKKRIVIE